VSEQGNFIVEVLAITYCIGQSLAFSIRRKLGGLAAGGGGASSPNGLFGYVRLIEYRIRYGDVGCSPFVSDIAKVCTLEQKSWGKREVH
jgi:hypothetical protein